MTPYETLPSRAFWRTAVASRNPLAIEDLWSPKWDIGPDTAFATAGSCFAQHIGSALRRRGHAWVNAEPAPTCMPESIRPTFGYDLFSFRTGNVYTASQLRQWLDWSADPGTVPTEIWTGAGRFYDPFRPSIEPNGFRSPDELERSRRSLLRAIADAAAQADVFIFTLGLTECWRNMEAGYEYHTCPGVVAGAFDKQRYRFHNQTFHEIKLDLIHVLSALRRINPRIRLLLTVSPVPLTATASAQHVLVATSHSKSVLRAVAGELSASYEYVDYFPSYEIISTSPFRGMFFDPNMRTVSRFGVDVVMSHLFAKMAPPPTVPSPAPNARPADPLCDDAALENFARR
ncbi:GSCFA domain-containing protein [uncultured Methylobacterium sp.]|uniref:GSCFA domain-containing protein n=1 Tax=uncultured Methylobacterium sp. TaxID=157278 RepID=UPI0035C96BDC